MNENIVPTNMPYNSFILKMNISTLVRNYPFLNVQVVGNSVLGKDLEKFFILPQYMVMNGLLVYC
jgi:hypothetical protein